jgi:hypothetical protein
VPVGRTNSEQIKSVQMGESGRPHDRSCYSKDGRFEIGCLIRIEQSGGWPLYEIIGLNGETLVLKLEERLKPWR